MNDLISRQAAINELWHVLDGTICGDMQSFAEAIFSDAESAIKALPSARPKPLTDKEQRIFLAAMGREKKVCKQVDEDYRDCREPYEDSLVRVCKEIERKVKAALWT